MRMPETWEMTMTNNPTIDGVSLMPCPFCGCQPRYVPADYVDNHGQPWPFAECDPCNVGAPVEFWQKRTGFDYSAHALQSTIAQLQARISELESGRGEPVAFIQIPKNVEKYGHADQADRLCFGKPGQFFVDGKSPMFDFIPLYTAPPAPVVVVLPTTEQFKDAFRATGYVTHEQAWELAEAAEACLDATAALNGGSDGKD